MALRAGRIAQRMEQAKEETRKVRWEATNLKTRYDTAIQTFEAQGVIKWKSMREILAEMR